MIFEDTKLELPNVQNAYNKLVNIDNVNIILTVEFGGLFSVLEKAQQDRVILINSLDVAEELAELDNVFSIGVYDEGIGYELAEFIPEKKIALIHNIAEPFLTLVKEVFEQKFRGEINEFAYDPDDFDARTIVLKASEADSFLIIGYDEAGNIVRQIRELGYQQPIYGIDTFTSDGFRQNARGYEEGSFFTFWSIPENNEAVWFKSAYEKKFSKPLEYELYAATGYDVMLMVSEALKHANFKQAMYKVEIDGVTGHLKMDEDGVVRSIREKMFVYKNGKIKSIN